MSTEVTRPALTREAAEELTARIHETTVGLWELIEQAREGRAWEVLGYPTWAAYVETEFGMTRQNASLLLGQATVQRAIEAAAEEAARVKTLDAPAPPVTVTADQARVLKANPEKAAAEIVQRVQAGQEPKAAVREVVERAKPRAVPPTQLRLNLGDVPVDDLVVALIDRPETALIRSGRDHLRALRSKLDAALATLGEVPAVARPTRPVQPRSLARADVQPRLKG